MKKPVLFLLVVIMLMGMAGCSADAPARMPVVLLTDFGNADYNVPRLKGIIYAADPEVRMIDATHGLPAMDVAAGAFVLDLTAREFPANVLFLAIVGANPRAHEDRYLVLLNNRDQTFIAPDNGLLSYVINNTGVRAIYQISNPELFEKKDGGYPTAYSVLGYVSARLAAGYPPEKVGTRKADAVMLDIQRVSLSEGTMTGSVVFVDNFGNCLTNISDKDFAQLGLKSGDSILVKTDESAIEMKIGTNYSSVPVGQNVAFINSIDALELSVNFGSFAAANNIGSGTKITLRVFP